MNTKHHAFTRLNPSGKALAKILIVIALVAAVVFGKVIGEKTVGFFRQMIAAAKSLGAYPESAWTRRTVGEMTFDAPFGFEPGPDIRSQLPPEVQKVLLRHDMQVSEKSARFMQVNAARIEYAAGIPISLDGAAEGAITEVATKLGDKAPKFTITPGTIDGLEARHSTYHSKTDKGTVHVASSYAQRGQVVWQLSVVYETETSKPGAQRVLESLHIKPAP